MQTATELRIAITMREVQASGYDEPRDALARNWGVFMQAALPEAAWLAMPNLGADAAVQFCKQWNINALIFSGGEDLGQSPVRDATERALLQYAQTNNWPVFGVCRGLQLMWSEFGGELEHRDHHVAVRHTVHFTDDAALALSEHSAELNSYHANCLRETNTTLRQPHKVFARASDGSAEGVRFGESHMVGVMWHPERESAPSAQDLALIRKTFGLNT